MRELIEGSPGVACSEIRYILAISLYCNTMYHHSIVNEHRLSFLIICPNQSNKTTIIALFVCTFHTANVLQ